MTLDRRLFLLSAAALPACQMMEPRIAMPDAWRLGYTNPPADGFEPAVMRKMSGRLPDAFGGTLYRNGPAQFAYGGQTAQHWFDGDGMVQAIRFEGGAAVHRGRFVATPKRKGEQAAGRFLAPGFGTEADPEYPLGSADDANAANTSVLMSGGELLALWEGGSAWRMDPDTLESRGPKIWRDDLAGMPFLAHPKREPDGTVWNLAPGGRRVGFYRINPDGTIRDFGLVDIGVAAYMHDWAMTASELIILVQPWILKRSRPPFAAHLAWEPERGLVAQVYNKNDFSLKRTVQCPPRAFYHTGSAWTDADGAIHLDVAFYDRPVLGQGGGANLIAGKYATSVDEIEPEVCLLTLPIKGDGVLRESGLQGEFLQADPRRSGLFRRHVLVLTGRAPGRPGHTGVARIDWNTGDVARFDFGPGQMVEEFLVVPKPGDMTEAAAWAVGRTLNLEARASEVHVFDLARLADGPVVTYRAPRSWPLGFHGTFVAA